MIKENEIVHICFIARNARWFHKILQRMSPEQKAAYNDSPLPELSRSISRKYMMLELISAESNDLIKKINEILSIKHTEVKKAFEKGACFSFPRSDEEKLYKLILLLEGYITSLNSCSDFCYNYVKMFQKKILGQIPEKHDLKWKRDLSSLRSDFVHNYSSWISFIHKGSRFVPQLTLAESYVRHPYHKKYGFPTITLDEINKIVQEMDMSIAFLMNALIARLDRVSGRKY